ncbi:MAG: hypothetical protein WBM28_01075, partial [Burkholderiales bacterium]
WFGSAGAAYRTSAVTSMGVMFDARQPSRDGAAAPREITAYLSRALGEQLKLSVYASRGLSRASPEWDAGAMLGHSF